MLLRISCESTLSLLSCHDDVSNLLFKQNSPVRLAMKRTADQAGLPDSSHRLRLTVVVPPDKVTDDRTMNFFVGL